MGERESEREKEREREERVGEIESRRERGERERTLLCTFPGREEEEFHSLLAK